MKQVAEDLGISENLIYRWRKKYTQDGDKTRYATLEEEMKALKIENAELKIERFLNGEIQLIEELETETLSGINRTWSRAKLYMSTYNG